MLKVEKVKTDALKKSKRLFIYIKRKYVSRGVVVEKMEALEKWHGASLEIKYSFA